MHNIMLIGAGQLGSRHLQGMLLSHHELNIVVVDPFSDSLVVAEERASQVSPAHPQTRISYVTAIPNLNVDICIIATAAHIRAQVTEELLTKCQVRHIIFEKVLFQKEPEYQAVVNLLDNNDTQGWVNCPRRLYPTYRQIKSMLASSDAALQMKVSGSSWGMACNSIHFIDLFSYLVEVPEYNICLSNLDEKILSSKRAGFYEVTGELKMLAGEHELIIKCGQDDSVAIKVEIKSGNQSFIIDETAGVWFVSLSEGEHEEKEHMPTYQSQLTGQNIDELLEHNKSSLTTFHDSVRIHIPFIRSLQAHMSNSMGIVLNSCPIT
ncbi:Gfo/Idh/MocA family oxidoreductase [Zobellella maritima]|uniref:Gfo/Idh/MocA family oxidoreductase n=1 Tax=Zobellella maritima TaxID=2059725 RepID=UPI000E3075D0|nr:Gfo/Idh/MocA family oxidoreductase [Zobellella maritima]